MARSQPPRPGGRSDPRSVMGDKSPKKDNAKKPGKSLKEKRQEKHQKKRESRGVGGSS